MTVLGDSYRKTFGHLGITITCCPVLCNKMSTLVSQVTLLHSAKLHDFVDKFIRHMHLQNCEL